MKNETYGPIARDSPISGAFDIITDEDERTFSVRRSPSTRDASISKSLLALSSIKDSPEYVSAIRKERYILFFLLMVVVILGPLIFRFCLGAQTSKNHAYPAPWGENLDNWEWFLLAVVFINMDGFIVRLLPVICGKPATIESVKNCSLEGSAVLCVCSPFCSEDDILLIRNLLGRTCTLFATVNGRHDIAGLYLDATLNERRLKGEANRKNIFLQWMAFLTTLIKLCQKKVETKGKRTRNKSQIASDAGGDTGTSRFNTWARYGQSVYEVATVGGSDAPTFNRAIVVDKDNEVRIRSSTIAADMRISHTYHSDHTPFSAGDVEDGLQSVTEASQTRARVDTQPGDRNIREMLDKLEVDMDVIEPVVSFLAHWLRELKNSEKVNSYGDRAL